MAMPKKQMSHSRSGNRRSHLALSVSNLSVCSQCKTRIQAHRVCGNCGYYKGQPVVLKKAA